MLKPKYITGIIAAAAFAVILGGCAVTADSSERLAKADTVRQTPPPGNEEDSKPIIATFSTGEKIEWAIYSEGCYFYSNGSFYGYLAEDGKEIASCIYSEATPFSEGLACVYLDGKYGYIGKDGEIALPFLYDQASPFREGTAYFSCGEEYGLIDREGNVVLRLDCDSISSFREGLAYFSEDGRYGYMDQSGRVVIEPVYDDAGYFYDGLATVRKGGFFGLIGKDGREVLSPEYSSIRLEETYIIAEKDDLVYCFDREGRELPLGAWDRISEEEGMLRLRRDNRYGLADGSGKIILEPVYEYIDPIPGKELAIVKNENREYGVLDYAGQVKVPFIYSYIYADDGGGLCVTDRDTEKVGYLDGEDFSVKIPVIYDILGYFTEGRAVVGLDGKYGVIRYDGTLELPLEYDRINLFSDGSMAAWTGETAKLTDRQGNLILTGRYDIIWEQGNGYEITEDGKDSYWDRQGRLVASGYRWSDIVQGARNTYILHGIAESSILLRTGEEDGQSAKVLPLSNWITPKAGLFMDYLKNGVITVQDGGGGHTAKLEGLRQYCWNFSKLYRIEGQNVLYFYTEPWRQWNFPESYSGLFTIRDGQVEQLISGYECGGSLRGDYVCFWYDKEEDVWKSGTWGNWGGFGGYAWGGEVYTLKDGQAVSEISFMSYDQTVGNYDEEDLLENAGLFYNEEDHPYTEETILDAGYVMEYLIDWRRVSVEEYRAAAGRYRYQYYLAQEW